MVKKDVISIIIPIYNLEKYLNRCLESVKAQEFQDFECLLIDDGSTDGSEEICRKYVEEDSRFYYQKKENGGVSSARNKGLDLCTGKYICFVDGDDIIEASALTVLYESMISHRLDFVQGKFTHDVQFIDNKDNGELQIFWDNRIYEEVLSSSSSFMPCVWGGLFKCELLKNLRFDTAYKYGEDFLFLANYLKKCRAIGYINRIVYHYLLNDNSATQSKENNNLKKVSDTLESLEKGLELCENITHYFLLEERVFKGIENWLFYQLVNFKLHKKNDEITQYLEKKLLTGSKNYCKNPYIKKRKKLCLVNKTIAPFSLAILCAIEKYIVKIRG